MLQLQSLNTQLLNLKMEFNKAIMQGHSFSQVKKIYTQIKEIEKLIAEKQLQLLKGDMGE